MVLVNIKSERLFNLCTWLASHAEIDRTDIQVLFMANGEIRLKATADNGIEYGLKVIGDQVTFHTKSFVEIL